MEWQSPKIEKNLVHVKDGSSNKVKKEKGYVMQQKTPLQIQLLERQKMLVKKLDSCLTP